METEHTSDNKQSVDIWEDEGNQDDVVLEDYITWSFISGYVIMIDGMYRVQ